MRQVPAYLLLGSGRVARHFQRYFDLLQIPYKTWSRRDPQAPSLEALSETASPILLLLSDPAIAGFIEEYPFLQGKKLVHFSGSLSLPGVYAAHPLMSAAAGLLDLAGYQKIPFFLAKDSPDLAELLPGLPNPSYRLPPQERAYYHALCVLSGNFTVLLWQKIFQEFEARFQVPKEGAYPYLQQVLGNLMENPQQALTGPLVRKDHSAIAAHLAALENDPFQGVYQAFVDAYRRLTP